MNFEHIDSNFQVYIENTCSRNIGGFTIPMPTTQERIQHFLEGAEIRSAQDLRIVDIRSDIEDFGAMLHDILRDCVTDVTLSELNYLASKVIKYDSEERDTLMAALEKDSPHSLADVINMTENLGSYYLQPAYNADMYGEFRLEMAKDEFADVFNKLESSPNQDDRDFAKYIERLEKHVDMEAYVEEIVAEEGGYFTENGYLTEDGTFSHVYHGPDNIPAAYRLEFPPILAPQFMVTNTDLTAMAVQIHAVCGDYSHDVGYNINVLEARRSSEYLMVVTDHSIFLTAAIHAYRHESSAYDVIMQTAHSSDVKVFALHVTDVHGEHVMGDIVTVDLAELQRDIERNCILFTHIEAIPKFGAQSSVIFTPEQWNAMLPINRDRLENPVRQFDTDDLSRVIRHVEDFAVKRLADGCKLEASTFLHELNDSYMQKSQNLQTGMLRVALPAAKEMHTHGDADVYRLLPEGAKALSPLDVLPGRSGLLQGEFAIKKLDAEGLNSWADRKISEVTAHRHERNTQEKTQKQTHSGPDR